MLLRANSWKFWVAPRITHRCWVKSQSFEYPLHLHFKSWCHKELLVLIYLWWMCIHSLFTSHWSICQWLMVPHHPHNFSRRMGTDSISWSHCFPSTHCLSKYQLGASCGSPVTQRISSSLPPFCDHWILKNFHSPFISPTCPKSFNDP